MPGRPDGQEGHRRFERAANIPTGPWIIVAPPSESRRQVPDQILQSRLMPPTLPPLELRRSGFADGALKSLEAPGRIIAVFAPAGYAKTSLLRTLYAELGSRPGKVAWLSLGRDADTPDRFVIYLTQALEKAGVRLKFPGGGDFLLAAGNTLGLLEEPLTLLIDDLQSIRLPETLGLIDQLLQNLPPAMRVVLAGRTNPVLRLGSLFAQRRLKLIDPSELVFSFAEMTEFVIRESAESFGAAALNELYEQTRGWPGLLSVLLSSHTRRTPLEASLRDGQLPQREMSAYILEEIVSELSAVDRLAMDVLALTPQVDQALMNSVIDESSRPDLEEVSRRNPLVRPVGKGSYVVHPAVRHALRARLESGDRIRYTDFCKRLAGWYRNHGNPALAIDYLIDSGELVQASALLETEGRDIALGGFPDRCLAWLARLHPEHLDQHPGLQLTEVWARVTMHETTAAARALDSARLRGASRRNPTFKIEVMTATAFSHAISDQPGAALAAVEEVPESVREQSAIVRAGCASVQAWCLFSEGRFNEARSLLYRTAGLEMQGQGLLIHTYASIVSGESYAAEGHLASAEAIFRRVVTVTEALRGRRSMVVVVALGPLLEILYESDRIDEVLALASGRSHLRLKYSTPGSTSAAGVALAHSLIQRNAHAEASELLDDMLRVGEEGHLPRIVAHALAAKIQIALRDGKSHEIAEMSGRLGALRDDAAGLLDSPQGVINYLSRLSRVRVHFARGDFASASAEAEVLSREIADLPWVRVKLAVATLLAAIDWASGAKSDAIERRVAVVQRAAPLGLVRSIVDQITDPALIESAELRRAVPAPLHAYIDRLKSAMTTNIPAPQSGSRMIVPGSGWTDAMLSGQDPGFTTREREILFLVSRGLSTKRIAQTLRISPETAKWHTRNVYEKLGVHDRPSAQLAIRRLQLSEGGASSQR